MNNDNISFSIPRDPLVIKAVAMHLLALCEGSEQVEIIKHPAGASPVNVPSPQQEQEQAEEAPAVTPAPPPQSAEPTQAEAPTPPPPPPPATVEESSDTETDAKGMPWDARIHSATKSKNKDGSWRYKRGIDKSIITDVEGELIGETKAPVIENTATPPPPPPANVNQATEGEEVSFTPPNMTEKPNTNWTDIITKIVELQTAGKFNNVTAEDMLKEDFGLGLTELASESDKWDDVYVYLDNKLKG